MWADHVQLRRDVAYLRTLIPNDQVHAIGRVCDGCPSRGILGSPEYALKLARGLISVQQHSAPVLLELWRRLEHEHAMQPWDIN